MQSDFFENADLFNVADPGNIADPGNVVASTYCGATLQSPTDELSLYSRDNGDSCDLLPPPSPALSPNVLQLFQDPLNSIEETEETLPKAETPMYSHPILRTLKQEMEEDPKEDDCNPAYPYRLCCKDAVRDDLQNYPLASGCYRTLMIKKDLGCIAAHRTHRSNKRFLCLAL